MKDKVIKGLIRATCVSVFYLIFEYVSRNWGLVETRRFLYILIMFLYLWKDNWTQKKPKSMIWALRDNKLTWWYIHTRWTRPNLKWWISSTSVFHCFDIIFKIPINKIWIINFWAIRASSLVYFMIITEVTTFIYDIAHELVLLQIVCIGYTILF